jgi:hypothetical protein
MNADCAFEIGSTHAICQDYAVASNQPDRSYTIVSDGCSSSPHTDIGARLIVRATTQLLSASTQIVVTSLHREAAYQALKWAKDIGLPDESVDATLLTANVQDGKLVIGASGDGVVVLESTQGTVDVYSISFPSGFPLYPAYQFQPDRLTALLVDNVAGKEIRHFQAPGPGGPLELVSSTSTTNVTESMQFDAEEYKLAVIISDGVQSFYTTETSSTSRHTVALSMQLMLPDLIGFKSGHGTFVSRRAKRFARQCASTGVRHSDDLAIGAIYLNS